MERMVGVARQLGYMDDLPPLVPVADLGYLPPEEVLVIATGSQGEPWAALSRLSRGRHPHFELMAGDTVIFSAKAIPGNERLIQRLKAGLRHFGVSLFDEENHPELHASGHPAQEELRTFYGWVRPRHLLPVHGEARHQQAHQSLATSLGIEAPVIPTNGDLIRLDADGLSLTARHPSSRISSTRMRSPPCRASAAAMAGIAPVTAASTSPSRWRPPSRAGRASAG